MRKTKRACASRRRPAAITALGRGLLRLARRAAGARLLVVVAIHRVLDLLLRGARVLRGHGHQVFAARELAVAVAIGILELLGERRVARRLGARDVAVVVLVQDVEAGIVLVGADLVAGGTVALA